MPTLNRHPLSPLPPRHNIHKLLPIRPKTLIVIGIITRNKQIRRLPTHPGNKTLEIAGTHAAGEGVDHVAVGRAIV